MIEFELKYRISDKPMALLQYEELNNSFGIDTYYDTPDFKLFLNGNFLRIRNDKKLEFKLFAGDLSHLYCSETSFLSDDIYTENSSLTDLISTLGISAHHNYNNLEEFIHSTNLVELVRIKRKRKQYRFDKNITISYDEISDLGCFIEAECCFELIENIPKEELKNDIEQKLVFQQILTGKYEYVPIGYVELMLRAKNRELYLKGFYILEHDKNSCG